MKLLFVVDGLQGSSLDGAALWLSALGAHWAREGHRVDVVCTHMPPRLPWYTYDVVARKFEPGSVGLISYIQEHRPAYALFGHVHQPLMDRGTIGPTKLVNVGHFQADGRGWVYESPPQQQGGE